jgi:glycosyltransferase involved in cell wall biosynthesis
MRIALLSSYLDLGTTSDSGIGRHYRVLADALASDGHEVAVFHPTLNAETARKEYSRLAPPWSATFPSPRIPAWLDRRLARSWPAQLLLLHLLQARASARAIAREHNLSPFDIVETHSYNLPGFFLRGPALHPPLITRVSTTLRQMIAINPTRSRIQGLEARLESRILRRADRLLTHSREHRDQVCREERLPPDRFLLVPHGLPDPGAPPPPTPQAADDAPEFLFVGRFEKRKGIDTLLAAIPRVVAACPLATFTLAGSQGDGAEWRAFVENHPSLADSRVRAPGKVSVDELNSLYRRCSVLVAPSRYESFGLIYVEAMSHAKPTIGCFAGGIPDVVSHEKTGLLVPPDSPDQLADALIRLARDPALRARLGIAARNDYLARFSATTLARLSADCYRTITAAPR